MINDTGTVSDFADDLSSGKSYPPSPVGYDDETPKTKGADDSEDDLKRVRRMQWNLYGPGQYIGAGRTMPILLPGVYSIQSVHGEPLFVRRSLSIDDLMEFPDSVSDSIIEEIENFWKKGKVFAKYGFLHRRGYLMYGPAGSGKTCLVQQIISRIINHKGIVFLCEHPGTFLEGLSVFREVEPNRPVVCIYEDVDAIIAKYGEDKLLSVLDGESMIDKALNLATTNYPERLDKRIISRPRRFDRVIKIGMPSKIVRELYFSKKLNIKDTELSQWVNATEGFSFAGMSELVISVKCLGNDFKKSVDVLNDLLNKKVHSKDLDVGRGVI